MKKFASILGIGMVSMAVALAPAFAQQIQPQENAGSSAIAPKSDVKTPATGQVSKDGKDLQAKPGDTLGKQSAPAKSAVDMKSTVPTLSSKQAGDVKNEKSTTVKTGSEVKNNVTSNEPNTEVKTGSASIQPKSDVKTPATGQVKKDGKDLQAKPGDSQGKQLSPAKPSADVKATVPNSWPKQMGDIKTEKSAPAKTGTEVKNEEASGKPGQDVKAGSVSRKTDSNAENRKGVSASRTHT